MYVVGADGCGAGQWFSVSLKNRKLEAGLFNDAVKLWETHRKADLILMDVPIGLRARGSEERCCDRWARKILGPPRASSVFYVPCRPEIYEANYKAASEKNYELSGKKLPTQSWRIRRYILQVDRLLTEETDARKIIKEVHPEICFWALAGGRPMQHKKTTEEGFAERRNIVERYYKNCQDLDNVIRHKPPNVNRGDILDALSVLVTAVFGLESLVSIPEITECDEKGFPMQMLFLLLSIFNRSKLIKLI